jgi:hypothetical protein
MPVSRAQKKAASVKARQRKHRKAQQVDYGSDDDKPRTKTTSVYQPSISMYDEDTEDAEDYRPGGYHPLEVSACHWHQFPHVQCHRPCLQVGETLNGRYLALRKLGWGQFSTVWLCQDLARIEGSSLVAVKIQKSSQDYTGRYCAAGCLDCSFDLILCSCCGR